MSHKIWKIQSASMCTTKRNINSTNNFQNYKVFKPAKSKYQTSSIKHKIYIAAKLDQIIK